MKDLGNREVEKKLPTQEHKEPLQVLGQVCVIFVVEIALKMAR